MATPYKKPKKGKLRAAFIDAAQIMRNILVFEPANKHRIKHDIYQERLADKDIKIGGYEKRIDSGIVTTVSAHGIAFLGFGIGAAVSGGALLPIIGASLCLFGVPVGLMKICHFTLTGGYERIDKRFERQANKKIKRLTNKRNKKARQLLLNGDI